MDATNVSSAAPVSSSYVDIQTNCCFSFQFRAKTCCADTSENKMPKLHRRSNIVLKAGQACHLHLKRWNTFIDNAPNRKEKTVSGCFN